MPSNDNRARTIKGSCHCGNIRYRLVWPSDEDTIVLRSCQCGFCQKHRGRWTSHRNAKLAVEVEKGEALERYRFGTGTAEFLVCRNCGMVPAVISEVAGKTYGIVSGNCMDDLAGCTVSEVETDFDGEAVDDRLSRRERNWIPEVQVTVTG